MIDTTVRSVFNDRADNLGPKVVGIYGVLIIGNIVVWIWAVTAFRSSPVLLGTAFLAYTFGLRHAFDADHIVAIDNVTRKLMQNGKRPLAVGFFFSLGHSTVVLVLLVTVALTTTALTNRSLDNRGHVIGTTVSALFLFAIAAANVVVLNQVYEAFRAIKCKQRRKAEDFDQIVDQRGFLCRIFRRLFRLIERSWHMYPLGLLFGLGFDTATEVGLLGISARQASQGMSMWSILIFPALFTAGMSLMDTTDGVVMLGAYNWAFVNPVRKLYYNLVITFVAVVAAVVVGGVEVLGLIGEKLLPRGSFWNGIRTLSNNPGALGYATVALFIVIWLVSIVIYHANGYDRLRMPKAKSTATALEEP